MSRKIRVGNDIDINWSLLDKDEQPYIVEGRTFRIELLVGSKRVRIPEATAEGNRIHFVYYGKDQKNNLGSVNLIYIENDGVVDMVTFDTKDAFTMVPHSWLALDEDETPETITLEVVTVVSALNTSVGPRGQKGDPGDPAGFGEVTVDVDGDNTQPPSADVETDGPNTEKNFHFHLHNIQGPDGPRGATGGVYWPEIYVDDDMHLHIVEPTESLGTRLYVQDGYLYAID